MKVNLKVSVSGLRDGKPWPDRGETVDLPDDEAAQMIAAGQAEPVEKPKPEKATARSSAEKR